MKERMERQRSLTWGFPCEGLGGSSGEAELEKQQVRSRNVTVVRHTHRRREVPFLRKIRFGRIFRPASEGRKNTCAFPHLCHTSLLWSRCDTRSRPGPGRTPGTSRVYTGTDCRGWTHPGPAHHTEPRNDPAGSGRSRSKSWWEGRCHGHTWGRRHR